MKERVEKLMTNRFVPEDLEKKINEYVGEEGNYEPL